MKPSPAGSGELSAETSAERLLEQLNEGYIRGVASGDGAWFAEHLAEDFSSSAADGSLIDKTAFLAQVTRPSAISGLGLDDAQIRIIGNTAIIHGWTRYRNASGGPAAGRYTDIWMLRGGRWRCIAAHVTRG